MTMLWHHRQVVRPRSAKPLSPVRIWLVPPILFSLRDLSLFEKLIILDKLNMPMWRNGRRKGLKIPRGETPVPVRVRPSAPRTSYGCFFC